MTITIPANIGANPLRVTVNAVTYSVSPGTTVTVPDAVGNEILRMIEARKHPTPTVDLPFGDSSQAGEIGALETRMAAVEAAAAAAVELPELPESDGTYTLQLVVDDGAATLSWEAVDSGADGSGD